jgi:hypothetical protein
MRLCGSIGGFPRVAALQVDEVGEGVDGDAAEPTSRRDGLDRRIRSRQPVSHARAEATTCCVELVGESVRGHTLRPSIRVRDGSS